jgi:hypothetical protein
MANIQLFRDDRPSKEAIPDMIAIQLSWTASSAADRSRRNDRAKLTMELWCFRTSVRNAASSPLRNASRTSSPSPSVARLFMSAPDQARFERESAPHTIGEIRLEVPVTASAVTRAILDRPTNK